MFFDYRKSVNRSFWLLTLINLVTYACFHTMYNLSTETGVSPMLVTVFYYLDLVMSKCCDFVLPVIIASAALLLYGRCEGKKWLISTALLSVSVAFYSYPYYYIYHITLGFSTPESLGYALLASLVSILALAAHSLLLFLAAYLSVRFDKRCGKVREEIAARAVYTEKLEFRRGLGFFLFIICLCEMLYRLAFEIYDTVVFFVEVGLAVTAEEVLTVIFSYLLIIGLFALGVFFCDAILRYKFKNDFYEVTENADGNSDVG